MVNAYSDIFKLLYRRIKGINESQLWHYASGMQKEEGLHRLGAELLAVNV